MTSNPIPSVYVLTNQVNGKQYVGQTWRSAHRRWLAHKYDARYKATAIGRAIYKYGADAFTIDEFPLVAGVSQPALDEFEQALIEALNSCTPNGYNIRPGGGTAQASAETRQKMSQTRKGRALSVEHRAKLGIGRRGIPRPPETCAKISAARKQYYLSHPEAKGAISARHSGKRLTAAQRERLRITNRAAWTPERRAAQAERMRARKHTPEVREKIRQAHLRRKGAAA